MKADCTGRNQNVVAVALTLTTGRHKIKNRRAIEPSARAIDPNECVPVRPA